MKKVFVLPLATAAYALTATNAFAAINAQSACPGNGLGFLCFSASDLGPVLGSFITFLFVIVGLIALFFLVWGGIKWLISQGEKQAVEEARSHIINALIGLVVIFLSYLLVNLLLGFLTGGVVTLNHIVLPTLGNPNF